nr:hypothetical protein [Clostridia bacterium]
MDKSQYISELEKVLKILNALHDDQQAKKRKKGNLALLLRFQRRDVEKMIQYIRRFGLDEAENVKAEDIYE